jgi:hypothetical protein
MPVIELLIEEGPTNPVGAPLPRAPYHLKLGDGSRGVKKEGSGSRGKGEDVLEL